MTENTVIWYKGNLEKDLCCGFFGLVFYFSHHLQSVIYNFSLLYIRYFYEGTDAEI